MPKNSPTLDELRQRIADIESGKLPARHKAALKSTTSGLTRRAPLQRKTPLRSRLPKRTLEAS